MKEPTIIIGRDGIEYVVSGGKLVEKCYHKTVTDKSNGKVRHEVCFHCGKTLIYNRDTTEKSGFESAVESFTAYHGRSPNGMELSAML